MKRLSISAALLSLFATTLAAAPTPTLAIRAAVNGQIQLSWPADAPGFVLEQTDAISRSAVWQPLASPSSPVGNEFSVTLPAGAGNRFFRLRRQLTSVRASSPVNGETGVAVTRETVVHFSAPLATNAVVTTDNFFAGFGGRRVLARVELSSDRKKASLFYLEPLPGSARVVAVFDGSGLIDEAGAPLDPDGDGVPGGQTIVAFDTLNLTALPNTAVIGKVFASELVPGGDTGTNAVNKPLAGVTITVDGMEQTLRAVTDATGSFMLSPAPPGRFFVHIDGRTVTNLAANIRYPDKSYYPYVGKAWEAVAGETNNPAGGTGTIFLPLIVQGTLQPVSLTSDTTISFPSQVIASNPALAGVSVTVPANSLFNDNGQRGGKVGIAPVPPDRLPGPLPPGLEPPLVITVQTDGGLNFDKPAPICFPNLPDPVLGKPLPAGSKQALISFNHKKGIWEAIGSMTVSADGKMICTDPGTGILQPGWHGVGPTPAMPPPPAPQPPPCPPDDPSYTDCFNYCQYEARQCEGRCNWIFDQGKADCGKHNPKCLGSLVPIKVQCRIDCNKAFTECVNTCIKNYPNCNKGVVLPAPESLATNHRVSIQKRAELGPAGLAVAASPPSSDPVSDQIGQLYQQIAALLYPYVMARAQDFPADIQSQVDALQAQADALAGGDAARYNRDAALLADEALAALEANIGEGAGNAPPYPVLYMAEILRPSGELQLRGETGPQGQYTLFVPRDGTLVYVNFYDPRTKSYGIVFPHVRPNPPYLLPRFYLSPVDSTFADFDKDGLPDVVELVYGTDPANADSDGDGIPDGAEIDQGTNPLDGQPVRTGIIATANTPGAAVDLVGADDLLAVAEGTSGISLFSVSNPLNPLLIAQVDTPGNAQAVAISGNFIAAADGNQGLAIIDAADPSKAQIFHQVPLNGTAQGVAVAGNIAYVGLEIPDNVTPGAIATVDLITGTILDWFPFGTGFFNGFQVTGDRFHDLAVNGDELYVLTYLFLTVYRIGPTGHPDLLAQVPVGKQPFGPFRRLFVGGGFAYVSHFNGYSVVDVRDPAKPKVVTEPPTGQFSMGDLTLNGSGTLIGLTSVGVGIRRAVSLYDASQPANVAKYLTTFPTPGDAQAVTIHNGLAYVADSAAGIQVLNYLPFDSGGKAPAITLSTSATNGSVEAGSILRVTANATDDAQVRNVEFYVDGVKAFTDGNFPFEYRFDAPPRTASKTNFVLRARAVDTGGNFTWSDEITILLNQDVRPPRVLVSTPFGGGKVVSTLRAFFSEPMNPATVTSSFQLFSAGTDGQVGTADDVPVNNGTVAYDASSRSATLTFATPLPDGPYRALILPAAMDLSGNPLAAEYGWQFRVTDAVFWTRSTDGFWDDPTSWSSGAVPGPTDDIVIESIPGDVTITIGSGTHVFKSLVVGERVLLDGGTIKGGTINQSGGGNLAFTGHPQNTLEAVTVLGDLDLSVKPATAIIRNGLSVSGSIFLKDTALTFAGDQTFNGHVVLAGFSQLLIQPGTTLTLGPAAVIQGKGGVLGVGDFGTRKLINQGLISVDGRDPNGLYIRPTQFENAGTIECKNGSSLTFVEGDSRNTGQINLTSGAILTFSNGTWHNLGTLNASEATLNLGGTFTLADLGTVHRTGGTTTLIGVLDLGGGTLTLDATTGSWQIDNGTLKNGTLTQADGAKLTFSRNGQNVLDKIHVEGDLESNGGIVVRNGLTLTGNVILNSTGITFAGTQTFDNARITFNGFSQVLIQPGTTLTLGPAVVVEGKTGVLGGGDFGTRKLINQGLILSDVPGGTLTIIATQFENPGTLRADGAGASVEVRVTLFTNTGKIEELNGGKVVIVP